MGIVEKIEMSLRYGKMVYLISGVLSVTMSVLVACRPRTIPFCFIIKLLSIPVIHYLNLNLTKGSGIYFYINLGISRKEYYSLPFIVDFILYVLLMIISGLTGYAVR